MAWKSMMFGIYLETNGELMMPDLSHDECLALLAKPTTQTILEKLGFDFSDSGLSEYRKTHPNIAPSLIRAIVKELEIHSIFPPYFRDHIAQSGVFIRKQGDDFVLMDMDKPSVWMEQAFPTPDGAARGYIRKVIDTYWLQPDSGTDNPPKSIRTSWPSGKT
jgi:hypothetical protein